MAREIRVQIVGDSASLERSFRRASASASGFNRDMARAGRGVIAGTFQLGGLTRALALASGAFITTAGAAAGIRSAIGGFTQFHDTLQQIVGLSGVAQKQVNRFGDEVLNLAPRVGKSPQELAKALYFITSSGIAASKAMDVLTASAQASVAGLGDTQTVADAVTSAINAYGAANLSAKHATDVLVSTVREGKGEASAFAGVIGNVASLAAQLGVSFNEVGAALAAETRLGVDAETASVQLQQVFSNLVKVAPQAEKAFKSVGLSSSGLRQELGTRGLLATLQTIKTAFAGDLPALAKAFPNIRALRGLLALVGNQSAEVEQVFRRMVDTSGSLKTAFDAVSHDTAQQFRRLRASAQVLGISVGAIFAPLAGAVADALSSAASKLTAFFDRIGRARTVRQKLDIVFTGIENATKSAQDALTSAISRVDWRQVFAAAGGVADGFQQRLEQIDWSQVGKTIGDGIAKGITAARGLVTNLANRFEEAFRQVDFVKLGRAAGPGLAAAVVSAFATITDPAFWIKNWDLALAVALAAFGGSFAKIGGRLVAPFARLGLRMAGAVETGLLRVAERLGPELGRVFLSLAEAVGHDAAAIVRIVGRALEPIVGVVRRIFGRLSGVAQFVVKVLGIQAAINAITAFVKDAGRVIRNGFNTAWRAVEAATLTAVEKVVALLAKIPTNFEVMGHKIGFTNPFKSLDEKLKGEIARLNTTAAEGGTEVGNLFSSSFQVASASVFGSLTTLVNQSVASALAAVKKARDDATAGFRAADVVRTVAPAAAATTAGGATTAAAAVEKGFTLPFRLQLAQAKAEATRTTRDDLAVARQVRAFVLAAIPKLSGQKLLDAYGILAQANQALATDVKKAAKEGLPKFVIPKAPVAPIIPEKVSGQVQALANSFTVPLKLQVDEAMRAAKGLDVKPVLVKIRDAAQKALRSGRLAYQGQIDAWNTIKDVNDQLAQTATKGAAKFRHVDVANLFKGLGLTRDQLREARAIASRIGPTGLVPQAQPAFALAGAGGGITINGGLHLNGVQDVRKLRTELQRLEQRKGARRRGA